jgi:hypothetical protein
MHYFFTLLRHHACICFGPIFSPSSGGRAYNAASGSCFTPKSTVGYPVDCRQPPFATLYTRPPDDGLQMGPKHVEAWWRNKVKKQCIVLVYFTNTSINVRGSNCSPFWGSIPVFSWKNWRQPRSRLRVAGAWVWILALLNTKWGLTKFGETMSYVQSLTPAKSLTLTL